MRSGTQYLESRLKNKHLHSNVKTSNLLLEGHTCPYQANATMERACLFFKLMGFFLTFTPPYGAGGLESVLVAETAVSKNVSG